MSFYEQHVFFCVNQRKDGRRCCADAHANEMREYAKQRIKSLGLDGKHQIRINAAGCLDRCSQGPVLVIYPGGVWYTYKTKEDIDKIIDEHLVKGHPVDALMLKE